MSEWEIVKQLSSSRNVAATVASGSHIYVIGGDSNGPLDKVEKISVDSDNSLVGPQTLSPLNEKRQELAAVIAGGHVYAIGGIANNGALVTVERAKIKADGTLEPWQYTSPLVAPRYDHRAAYSRGYLYVMHGNARTNEFQLS